jgi:hypothetical protein
MMNLISKSLFSLALLLSQLVFAQAPETAVPIEQEPHHRIVFENKNVRIYDALIPPGEVTLFHTHSADSVAVAIHSGKGTSEFLGKAPTETIPVMGAAGFSKATYTHRVGNVGTTPLRFVGAEIKAPSDATATPANLDAVPGHKLVLENDRVKVYRISIDPKQSTGIRSRTLPWLRISVSQSTISVKGPGKNSEALETKPGDYRWYEGVTVQSLENTGATTYEAIEIEWK